MKRAIQFVLDQVIFTKAGTLEDCYIQGDAVIAFKKQTYVQKGKSTTRRDFLRLQIMFQKCL